MKIKSILITIVLIIIIGIAGTYYYMRNVEPVQQTQTTQSHIEEKTEEV